MELPTPAPGSDGTHDFLSLYTTTSNSHDLCTRSHSQSSQGGFIKTHNFLQPLEIHASKECNPTAVNTTKDYSQKQLNTASVQHILPGGIGTYTISHISCINQLPKPEVSSMFKAAQASSNERNDDNSNTSSQTGSGFTLWDESTVNKGKTGKENNVRDARSIVRESASRVGQWGAEKPSQTSFTQHGSFAPGSSSEVAVQNNRSFMDLVVSTKSTRVDPDDRELDFVIKKEVTPSERVRAEGKAAERKANTPRSKHSATEQRRRSKINDRFQMLREIIPHSDQKRDKASFLLEAIEYIQYLREKVHRYEGSFPGRNNESAKQIPSRNKCQPSQGFSGNCGPIHVGPSVTPILPMKISDENIGASTTISRVMQNQGDSEIINPMVVRPIPSQPKMFVESGAKTDVPTTLVPDNENAKSRQPQHDDVRHCKMEYAVPNDEFKDQEVNIEGGTINIASAYSRGFLNTLTHALESLGVDLSQSRISVQIDLGKQNNLKLCSSETMIKVRDSNPSSQVKTNSSLPLTSDYSGQAAKKLKTSNHL